MRVLPRGLHGVIHELVALGVRQLHVRALARHEHRDALRDRERLGVARRVGPRHRDLAALEAAGEALAQPHQVGERLRGVVDIALQVHDRDLARVLRGRQVVVDAGLDRAHERVAGAQDQVVADPERVRVHAEHRSRLFCGLAVLDLRRAAVHDHGAHAEARGGAGPRRLGPRRVVEEQRVGEFVRQQRGRAPRAVGGLEARRDGQQRVDLGRGPVAREHQAAAVERREAGGVEFGQGDRMIHVRIQSLWIRVPARPANASSSASG